MIDARRLAETALIWCGIDRWAARGRRGHCLVLAYHNLIPDDASAVGDQSLHLPRRRFAEQLDALVEFCDVVPLATILAERPRDARPAVAITFDDAYQGALTLGAQELRVRGMPATMFAAPGLLGGYSFWWDVLAGSNGLPDSLRDHVLRTLRGDGDAARAWANQSGHALQTVPPWARSGTETDLKAWAEDGSLSVAPHTWRHANLSRLTGRELEDELVRPLAWLREQLVADVLPWLAYPYGIATDAVRRAVRASGYEAALMVRGGWMTRPVADPYVLPRLNVPGGLTTAGFKLRLAGLVGSLVASKQQSL